MSFSRLSAQLKRPVYRWAACGSVAVAGAIGLSKLQSKPETNVGFDPVAFLIAGISGSIGRLLWRVLLRLLLARPQLAVS